MRSWRSEHFTPSEPRVRWGDTFEGRFDSTRTTHPTHPPTRAVPEYVPAPTIIASPAPVHNPPSWAPMAIVADAFGRVEAPGEHVLVSSPRTVDLEMVLVSRHGSVFDVD